MLDIVRKSSSSDGNGTAVSGRGLARRQLTVAERVRMAADLATGQRDFVPSLTQIAGMTGVTTWQLRAELKARAQLEAWRRAAEQRLHVRAEAEAANEGADAIASAWISASPEAREAFVRVIGPAQIWDTLALVVA